MKEKTLLHEVGSFQMLDIETSKAHSEGHQNQIRAKLLLSRKLHYFRITGYVHVNEEVQPDCAG